MFIVENMRLEDKVAVITGAGRGLGKEIALSMAAEGAHIAVMVRTKSQLEETAQVIESYGRNVVVIPIDVSDSVQVNAAIAETQDRLGPVDVLVNNAAVSSYKPLVDMTDEEWRKVMSINLDGPFYLCRAVGKQMVARKTGNVINIGSVLGKVGFNTFFILIIYSNIFSSFAFASCASGSISRILSAWFRFQYSLYHSLAMIMDITSLVPVQMEASRRSLKMRSTG